MDVSLSARIIMLTQPVQGFNVVALTQETKLISADGNEITLTEMQRGMNIQASGKPGESNALLADKVLILR